MKTTIALTTAALMALAAPAFAGAHNQAAQDMAEDIKAAGNGSVAKGLRGGWGNSTPNGPAPISGQPKCADCN